MYELEKAIVFTRDNLNILRSIENLAIRKFENGLATMVEVLRVQMGINESENKLLVLEEKRKPLLAAFNTLLHQAESTPVEIEEQLSMPDTTRQLIVADFEGSPEVLAIEATREMVKSQQELAYHAHGGIPSILWHLHISSGSNQHIIKSSPYFRILYHPAIDCGRF